MNKVKYSHKVIAFFLMINILQSVLPYNLLYASNNGPGAPEAKGFESVNATDMVNLSSGDMAYVLPVMDIGDFPVTLSYHGGIPLDLESTWTGLGWNLNTGAINRSLNATPDDWKGGNSLDFIRYQDSETISSINVGVGISNSVEVGVGASISSNKGLTGSVFATVSIGKYAGASGSIDSNGNYTLGVGGGTGKKGEQSFGGGMNVSGNIGGGKTSIGVSVGARTSSGMTVGVGASLDGGMSASLGYTSPAGASDPAKTQSGGGSLSVGSFSSGDWDIKSKAWYIPIQLPGFSIGFGQQKITYSLKKGYKKVGYGILYPNLESAGSSTDAVEYENGVDNQFVDYQNRFRYIDTYDQGLPVSEKEFVADYDLEREKLNFTFAGYDSYDVNATGVAGIMSPRILQNSTLYGMGYVGPDNNSPAGPDQGKQRIYYHNSLTSGKYLGAPSASNINFYFNGQFTQNTSIAPVSLNPVNASQNTLQSMLTSASNTTNRLKQGNYVEVFTNYQIKNGLAPGLLSPLNPTANGLSLTALNRTSAEYKNEGIGGYKITSPDGKVYHFSQPVYHFEQVDRSILKDASEDHVSEKRQYSSYATHWVLTAITGPDYIDTNGNNIADSQDYGYWIRMDYGKWSDGYVWRTPTDQKLFDYRTNIEQDIRKTDFGNYQFGRKQLYYLDRIVTATHTAYFVKDLRYDSAGSNLNYHFNPWTTMSNDGTGTGAVNETVVPHENFTYKRQLQLMLKKIILVKNSNALVSKGNSNNPLLLNTENIPEYDKTENLGFFAGSELYPSGGFYNEYGNSPIMLNNESGVYDVKDFENFNYESAIKVVDLEYNYNLGVKDHTNNLASPDPLKSKGSPGAVYCSKNPNVGKLCLKSVRFLGRNNFDYMPPYQFEYNGEYKGPGTSYIKYPVNAIAQRTEVTVQNPYGNFGPNYHNQSVISTVIHETPIENIRAKDEWGFFKDDPTAWTMTKITTPTGANIEFEHEEDDYFTEAFSNRYWTDNLRIKAIDLGSQLELEIQNQEGLNAGLVTDFSEYFWVGDNVFLDYWLCKVVDENCLASSFTDRGKINVRSGDVCKVSYVSGGPSSTLKILVDKLPNITLTGDDPGRALNTFYSKGGPNSGSNAYQEGPRDWCPPANGGCGGGIMRDHAMKYKLLANKVPIDRTGGGIRVKSITLKDENNNKYKTRYYYNVPGTNREKNNTTYKSSGITSYSPVKGTKFVPYQSQLPTPGVMYEYVAMVPQDVSGNELSSTLYNFYTLKPVMGIFDENIVMKDIDGTTIFKATVINHTAPSSQYYNVTKKIKAKSIKLDVNLSLIGQFKSIQEFNSVGQLMSKSEKKYLSGYDLKTAAASTGSNHIDRGSIAESFQSMKSIYSATSSNQNPTLKERYLSISTKEEYSSVLQSIVTTDVHGKTVQKYSKTDPETGEFLVIETQKADGRTKRVERVPAYKKYPEMGSKATNSSNRHMLSQEAMSATSVLTNGMWSTSQASINTWSKDWTYRNNIGGESTPYANSEKIWRKQKVFVLNKPLVYFDPSYSNPNVSSIYLNDMSNSNIGFDWTTGLPLGDKWKKASEVTRYNHYSIAVESKDVNNNFASSKMADNDTKVIVSGNARYTEMFYSGAEHVASNNFFEGEVLGADFQTSEVAHTGKYSVMTEDVNSKVFMINSSTGGFNYYDDPDGYVAPLRPGRYKVSVWGLNSRAIESSTKLVVNDNPIDPSEIQFAGCWVLFNFYIDLPSKQLIDVYLKNTIASQTRKFYYDDFRMHPVSSSINSFVYNPNRDELVTILDVNNLGKTFMYDDAGRLTATYQETVNAPSYNGGFKITGQFKQKYKGAASIADPQYPLEINNCLDERSDITLLIGVECPNTYETVFKTEVEKGSGNYTYQYQYLKNIETNEYSNLFVGESIQPIPFATNICKDGNSFDKVWKFKVKVIDNATNTSVDKSYEYKTSDCQFTMNKQTDIQVNRCSNNCLPEKYGFKLYEIDSKAFSNLKYEYAYYNPNLSIDNQNFARVPSNGTFCPIFNKAVSSCGAGFREYLHIVYKVTNVDDNIVLGYTQVAILGDCLEGNTDTITLKTIDPTVSKYLEPGYIVKLDSKGGLLEIVPIQRVTK